MDEAKKTINTTESGLEKIGATRHRRHLRPVIRQLPNHFLKSRHQGQFLLHRDVDYVVVNGEVKIVE